MKAIFVILVWISGLIQTEQIINKVTEIDLVLHGLNEQSWSQEELPCYKQTVFILENAKNYTVWAMMIWNSMQRPIGTFYGTLYSLGSYDQCIQNIPNDKNSTITTQYCLADVKLTGKQFEEKDRNIMFSSESYLGVRTNMNRDLSKMTWGTCLPASCKPDSVVKILKVIYVVNPITPDEPSITIDDCQVAGEERKYTIGFYIFLAFVIGLITAVLLSIFYVPYADCNSTMTRLLECFSLKRNYLSLTKDSSTDDIPTLNLTKVILSPAVLIIHSFYFTMGGPINNSVSSDQMLVPPKIRIIYSIVTNLDMAIDIYLIMSAVFFIKGLMTRRRHPVMSLLSRYFRLMGTYIVITFYIATVSMHTNDGPLWSKLAGREQNASSTNWPWSLLMLNNYIGSENINMMVAWYIPCDYQLTIMGTVIFMLWQKDKRFAKLITILLFILSILTPAVVNYWKRLPELALVEDAEKRVDIRKNEAFLEIYIQSQNRAAPYLLGLALGYMMTVYKPSKFRKLMSMQMLWTLFIAICLCGSHIMDTVIYWCGNDDFLVAAVYSGCRRFVFSFSFCSCIALIEYGDYSYLKKVAGHQLISILGRLTYGVYMTHTIILQYITFSRRNPHHIAHFSEITYAMGVWCMCIAVSIPLWFLVEAPISNIFNLVANSWQKPRFLIEVKGEKDLE